MIIVFDFEKFKKPFMSLMTYAHKLYHKIAAVMAQNHFVCSILRQELNYIKPRTRDDL